MPMPQPKKISIFWCWIICTGPSLARSCSSFQPPRFVAVFSLLWIVFLCPHRDPCFKYRPSRLRYRPISSFLPAADTIWRNRSSCRLQQKMTDIRNIGRQIARYRPINRPIYHPIWNNLFIARLRANVHWFYCLCKHITSFLLGRRYVWL